MTIKVNGEVYEVAATTVDELLQELGAPEKGVAVALNGQVVRRADLAATSLQPHDAIEIIRAVQGG